MEIRRIEKAGRGAFLIRTEHGQRLAEMTYQTTDGGFNIDHTEVDESLRGQKVGDQLLAEAVKYARENELKIHATCPFALAKIKRKKEYHDVFAG